MFGLRAALPAELAGPLDVRGDLTGTTVRTLAEWNGKLYLALDYADIAAWRTWVPFPSNSRGSGGLRTWLTFSQNQLTEAIADVRLADVRARIEKTCPSSTSRIFRDARLEMSATSFESRLRA